jgi:hypothetical protein
LNLRMSQERPNVSTQAANIVLRLTINFKSHQRSALKESSRRLTMSIVVSCVFSIVSIMNSFLSTQRCCRVQLWPSCGMWRFDCNGLSSCNWGPSSCCRVGYGVLANCRLFNGISPSPRPQATRSHRTIEHVGLSSRR